MEFDLKNEFSNKGKIKMTANRVNDLTTAKINEQYEIKDIVTNDEEIKDFLFTLGCYVGENITVISVLSDNYVVVLKDARYSIDRELAEAIII